MVVRGLRCLGTLHFFLIPGVWLLVSRLNIMHNSSLPYQLPWKTSYHGIAKYQMLLTQTAMKELRLLINFTQLRFHCKKNRTFHIVTVQNSSGEAVVQYFSGQTNVLPYACGSFYKMSDDDSFLAKKCQIWGKDESGYRVGKWGHVMDDILGSDQNETRLFKTPVFVSGSHHWIIGFEDRFECDDYTDGGREVFGDDFWEIFVR